MFNLDKFILDSLYSLCSDMGMLFGLGAKEGAYMMVIILGSFIFFMIGGKKRHGN
ncbi:MAG: hypothetical protein AB9836_05915 [Aminipila sp.]